MSGVSLSVVMPTFNRATVLRQTLLALALQDYPRDFFEVVVAVDGSTDDTIAMLQSISVPYRLSFSWAARAGTAPARNRALAAAAGEVVVSLDDDIIAHPSLLAAHAALHTRRNRAVGIGRLELWNGATLGKFARYWHRRFDEHYRKLAGPDYRPEFVDCLSGNLSVRREDMLGTGAFDPRFREYNHEDTELGYRLFQRGLTFEYLPDALGYHNFEKSFVQGCWDAYGDGRSSLILARKHPATASRLRLAARRKAPLPATLIRRALTSRQMSLKTLISLADRVRTAAEVALPSGLMRVYYAIVLDACYWRGARDQGREEGQDSC